MNNSLNAFNKISESIYKQWNVDDFDSFVNSFYVICVYHTHINLQGTFSSARSVSLKLENLDCVKEFSKKWDDDYAEISFMVDDTKVNITLT